MNHIIDTEKGIIEIYRSISEKNVKFYSDATVMYHIANYLYKLGYDCFRKDLSKEPGNLLTYPCYGIIAKDRSYQIYYEHYQIRSAYKDFNNGMIRLRISGALPVKHYGDDKL